MDVTENNPFGPICACNVCHDRKTLPYCQVTKSRKKKCSKRRRLVSTPICYNAAYRPLFIRHWAPGIPCEYCLRIGCTGKLRDFDPCILY
ncbi:CLUMA_CG003290, isoform A [Clunio marinus]|uniref:CLUMA_CG003290, isoform A n=1 Tax=Clunio marinus TaxID=568069 RepID=A0A1J1HQ37_9DIPT|nr:CLUMA_CG003290, isoform A [Clunio marinus]